MKVTVLSVTYNQLDKLKRHYESLIDQGIYIKEWILYDDASTDGTVEWMKALKPSFPYKPIYGKKREKPLVVANMNECIKAMDGGLFILVFADTYFDENALWLLQEYYVPNSFGSAFKVNVTEDGKFIQNHYNFNEGSVINMMDTSHGWDQFSGNGMIATKEIMERINYIDEDYAGYGIDDYDTAMRAKMNGALLFLYGQVKIYHIDHPNKESTQDNILRYRNKMEGIGYSL
jgi:GT2 family glycosyltransferase